MLSKGVPALSSGSSSEALSSCSTRDSSAGSGSRRSGRGPIGVSGGLGEQIDVSQYQKAKRTIAEAVKDMQTALQLAHIIDSGSLRKSRRKGKLETLPPCCNKYRLLGKDRAIELLMHLEPTFEQEILDQVKVNDLYTLIEYAICVSEKCALPSKVWTEVLDAACRRYHKLGKRLSNIVFECKGDAKARYYDVDYKNTGCFKLVKPAKGGKKVWTHITHVSGYTAKLSPALESSFYIHNNHNEHEAKLVSANSIHEVPVIKIFEGAKLLHVIPTVQHHTRVGQSDVEDDCTHMQPGSMLQIEDTRPALPLRPTTSPAGSSTELAIRYTSKRPGSAMSGPSGFGGVSMILAPPNL